MGIPIRQNVAPRLWDVAGVFVFPNWGAVGRWFVGLSAEQFRRFSSNAGAFFATLGGGKDTLTASGALVFAKSIHVTGGSDKDTLNGKTALTAAATLSLLLDLETIHA